MGQISDMIKKDFGAVVILGGDEYEKFPAWKKIVADRILEQGMSYIVMKSNLKQACTKTGKYVGHVRQYLNGEIEFIPLWSKPWDVQGLLLAFELLKAEIEGLIRAYNAD